MGSNGSVGGGLAGGGLAGGGLAGSGFFSGGVPRIDPPLRLTRRGRAVVLGLLVLMASLASAVLFSTASRAEEPPAGPSPTVVVEPGDTLWGIASRAEPGRNAQDAVDDLRRLNGRTDFSVHPGEVLVLPVRR